MVKRKYDEILLSDDDTDDVGGKTQPFLVNEIPPTPKKPKTTLCRRYSQNAVKVEEQEDDDEDDDEDHLFLKPPMKNYSVNAPTPKKAPSKNLKKKKLSENIINLAEADTPTVDYEKKTFFIGKNIYVENNVFKGTTYICLFRKDEGVIKNRFNLPVELAPALKKAVNLIADKNN